MRLFLSGARPGAPRRVRAGAALLAVLLLTAGCGSSGDGDGGGGATARGVTGDTIKIGIAMPDLGSLATLSKAFDLGDIERQIRAVVEGWRDDGSVPVHGRDLELVFRGFNILSADQQIGICNAFTRDDDVFAVVGLRFFDTGGECVGAEKQTPVITLEGAFDSVYQRTHPYLFTVRYSNTTMFRNWAHWAHERGALEGRRIGVYYESELEDQVEEVLEPELAELGYELTQKIDAGTGEGVGGGSQDAVAVQRFKSAGVEVLFSMTGASQLTSVMGQADSLDYRPTFLSTEFGDHTSDPASIIFIPGQYDGTEAMTGRRVGRRGEEPHERKVECVENYERYSDQDIPIEIPESARLENVLLGCDVMSVLLLGLEHAGEELTHETFVAGLEAIEEAEMAAHGSVSYSSRRHDGATEQKTAEWSAECKCWEALTEFQPLWTE